MDALGPGLPASQTKRPDLALDPPLRRKMRARRENGTAGGLKGPKRPRPGPSHVTKTHPGTGIGTETGTKVRRENAQMASPNDTGRGPTRGPVNRRETEYREPEETSHPHTPGKSPETSRHMTRTIQHTMAKEGNPPTPHLSHNPTRQQHTGQRDRYRRV